MVKSKHFIGIIFAKTIKMGNAPSKKNDIKADQLSETGMRNLGFVLGQKIPLGGPFFIEAQQPTNDGIYGFNLYHLDSSGMMTHIFSFETFHPLKDTFKVVYNGSIVKFVFEIDSFEKGLEHILEFGFDFSKSFHSEKDSDQPLKSIPFLLPPDGKMTHLKGKYWYYILLDDEIHREFFIVKSSDKTSYGFESVFKEGDVVIKKINVESKNFPFVMNDEEGNLIIASADEEFVPIPICLPSDDISLTDFLGQETFP
jgi:hypothetical protein